MSDQLSLELDDSPAEERRFTCCGAPCPPLGVQTTPSMHADGCPNPNLWMLNSDGSPRRLLWCSDDARRGGPCPHTPPPDDCCKRGLLPAR